MNNATRSLIAAVAALTLSGGAYAQSNNSLARPSVTSPAAVATGGYGAPSTTNSESGRAPNSVSGTAPAPTVWPNNNSLARPSVTSPAAGS